MIILHGALLEERFFLWGEAPDDSEASGKGNGRATSKAARPYPFDAGFDAIARSVKSLPIGFKPTRRRAVTAAVWLPSEPSVRSALDWVRLSSETRS